MQSAILSALPTVHITALTVGGAFLCAYGLYANQKILESADDLDRSLQEAESFGPPQLVVRADVSDLVKTDGSLNWGHVREAIWRSIAMMQGPSPETNPMLMVDACKRLCYILYLVSTSAPFSQNGADKKPVPPRDIGVEQLNELRRRLRFLTYTWQSGRQEILRLGEGATELEPEPIEHEGAVKRLTDEQRQVLRASFIRVNYAAILQQLFEHFVEFQTKVLPSLERNVRLRDLYRNRFSLRRDALAGVFIGFYVLIVGVILPPLLQNLAADFHFELRAAPYALLILSFGPYAWLGAICLGRVLRLE